MKTAQKFALIFIVVYVNLFANSSRRISQALSEAKSALANQKKISEIGSLSAAAVHELSTPLNTIFLILNDFTYLSLGYGSYQKKKLTL